MIGADFNALKTMLGNSFQRADKARAQASDGGQGAGQKVSARGDDAAAAKPELDTNAPGFLLSASLDDLKGKLRKLSDNASDGAKTRVAHADEGLARIEGIAAHGKALASDLDQVMDAMSRDLERTMKALGFEDPDTLARSKRLSDRFKDSGARDQAVSDLLRRPDAPPPPAGGATVAGEAVSVEETRTALTVRNIELTVEVGGKSLTISYENAAFSVESVKASAFAASDGGTTVSGSRLDAVSTHGQSETFGIKAEGFSKDEIASIAAGINELTKQGDPSKTFEGLVGIKEIAGSAAADGSRSYAVDLAGFLDDALGIDQNTAVLTIGAGANGKFNGLVA